MEGSAPPESKQRAVSQIDGDQEGIYEVVTRAPGPDGSLPLTDRMLREEPSGNLFGLTQNVGMGWDPTKLGGKQVLILSTQGGLRGEDGKPVALGYHTGHWEIGLQVRAAAEALRGAGAIPFSATCSDPCDGRTQGTTGMFDSLPYRNDAAMVFRRLIRSLPRRQGVIGVATCDKGMPAMLMALASARDLPCVVVPGGVTLPATNGEDAGAVQTIGGAVLARHVVNRPGVGAWVPRVRFGRRRVPVSGNSCDFTSGGRGAWTCTTALGARAVGSGGLA